MGEKAAEVFRAFVQNIPDISNKENLDLNSLKLRVDYICKRIYIMLKECKGNKSYFLRKYSEWLSVSDKITSGFDDSSAITTDCNQKRGRPRKDFSECGTRTKQRRLAELSHVDKSLRDSIRDASKSSEITPIDPNEVVSLIVETKLTKHQYLLLRDFINNKLPVKVLPSYKQVLIAKKKCYPEEISVTETSAEVELQSLLDHTASRLIRSQKDAIENVSPSSNNLILFGKWGFDGSSSHKEYKQMGSESNSNENSLFVTSYVPLRLVDASDETIIVWKNPRPCSTRYCRPIRFQVKKESAEVSCEEAKYFKTKISSLTSTKTRVDDLDISVAHHLQLTMVDGKVCSALSETSSARCHICEAKPSEMNDIDKCLEKPVHVERFEFGLSTLHAWIRFFEYFIHLSYRLDFKKWQVRSKEDKNILSERKKHIQCQFRVKLGLIVDQPQTGGGTSNDGNTARRFFENSEISAELTGLDKCLIVRCATILKSMSSGYVINTVKFKDFALETARKLVQTYSWFYLPASIHKILIHGSEVIENAILPIGELSEEAAEAKNKDIRSFKLNHTRKMSRTVINLDLMNRLLLSSDPYVTGLRKLPKKKK